MEASGTSYQCPRCHQLFTLENPAVNAEVTETALRANRLTLDDWTVYPVDLPNQDLPLPQQVEGHVCRWLQSMAIHLKLMNNSQRVYGNIKFDQLGDIVDFEIQSLEPSMLTHGFKNWMNTLCSGELLLDIVNGLIDNIPVDIGRKFPIKLPFPVRRMLHTAPNQSAIFAFLLNYDRLLGDFLDPILRGLRPIEFPLEPGPVRDVRQALKMMRHIGHTLLRNAYTTQEWSWKALMLIVMILMALTGSLDKGLENIFYCLTGESDIEQLLVPELGEAHVRIKAKSTDPGAKLPLACMPLNYVPYRRVLKQGQIKFKSQLSIEFNLD